MVAGVCLWLSSPYNTYLKMGGYFSHSIKDSVTVIIVHSEVCRAFACYNWIIHYFTCTLIEEL